METSNSNVPNVANAILSKTRQTGQTPNALVTHLLRVIQSTVQALEKEKESKCVLIKDQEIERNNLLSLMYTVNQAATSSTVPVTQTSELTVSVEKSSRDKVSTFLTNSKFEFIMIDTKHTSRAQEGKFKRWWTREAMN